MTIAYEPYLVEEIADDMFCACFPPDDMMETLFTSWCREELDPDEWVVEYDEFYSPLSSGVVFRFTSEDTLTLFLLAWRRL